MPIHDERYSQMRAELALRVLGSLAIVSPLVGLSYLTGYLGSFGVFALHVVGPDDLLVSAVLAAAGILLLTVITIPAAAMIRALSAEKLSWLRSVGVFSLIAGVGLWATAETFGDDADWLGVSPLTASAAAMGWLILVGATILFLPWLIREGRRGLLNGLKKALGMALAGFAVFACLYSLPEMLGIQAAIFSTRDTDRLVSRSTEETPTFQDGQPVIDCDGNTMVVWSGSRAVVLFCEHGGAVVRMSSGTYRVVTKYDDPAIPRS